MLVPAETTIEPNVKSAPTGNESYQALVWRRLRRSFTGMLGLVLVCMLLFMAVFAGFLAPVDPTRSDSSFMPPESISIHDKDGNLAMPRTYPMVDSEKLDPVTFQPISGPDYDKPRMLAFSYRVRIQAFRHHPGEHSLLRLDGWQASSLSRHGQAWARYPLPCHLRFADFVDDRPDGGDDRDRYRHNGRHGVGYRGGAFDVWVQRFVELVLAFPSCRSILR